MRKECSYEEPRWVSELRREFPVAQKTTFLDIAYENCGAEFLRRSMERFFDHKSHIYPGMIKAGGKGKGDMIDVIAETRQQCAQLIGAKSVKNIAFTYNTNQGINLALRGFPFAENEHVLISSIEYPSILMACLNLKKYGGNCKVIESENDFITTAEEYIEAMDENTRVVVCSHVQSSSGYKIDLKKLSDECRRRNIFLMVDAIQALGFSHVDVNELGIDLLSTSCYKGLLATEGVGFMYCSDSLLELLEAPFAADNCVTEIDRQSWQVVCTDRLNACRFENGTISFIGIYGLNAGLTRLLEIGTENIERHIRWCYDRLYSGLSALGYCIKTPEGVEHSCHSIVFYAGQDSREAESYFVQCGVFLSRAKHGCLRLSIAPYTSECDIIKLLQTAKNFIEGKGVKYGFFNDNAGLRGSEK